MPLFTRIFLLALSLLLPWHGLAANVMPLHSGEKLGARIHEGMLSPAVLTSDSAATSKPIHLEHETPRPCHGHVSKHSAGHASVAVPAMPRVSVWAHEQDLQDVGQHAHDAGLHDGRHAACGECAACVACHLQALEASCTLPSMDVISGQLTAAGTTTLVSVSLPGPAKPPKSRV